MKGEFCFFQCLSVLLHAVFTKNNYVVIEVGRTQFFKTNPFVPILTLTILIFFLALSLHHAYESLTQIQHTVDLCQVGFFLLWDVYSVLAGFSFNCC